MKGDDLTASLGEHRSKHGPDYCKTFIFGSHLILAILAVKAKCAKI